MIYFAPAITCDPLIVQRYPDCPGEFRQRFEVIQRELHIMLVDEKEPVSAPRHIASNLAIVGNLHRNAGSLTIARHIRNGNFPAFMECCGDDTDRGFDAVLT